LASGSVVVLRHNVGRDLFAEPVQAEGDRRDGERDPEQDERLAAGVERLRCCMCCTT
jgi:hypothetical protein